VHTFIPFSLLKASSHKISFYLSLFDDNDLNKTIISHSSVYMYSAAVHTICGFFTISTALYYIYKLLYLMLLSPNTTFYLRRHLKCHRILWHYLKYFFILFKQTKDRAFQVSLYKLYTHLS